MGFFDLIDWRPVWNSAGVAFSQNASALAGLVGRVVSQVWGVWDVNDDTWIPDFPVVVCFSDGAQLEICWQKFDELSLTWSTAQINSPPRIHEEDGWNLQWRPLAVLGFDLPAVLGDQVTGVFAGKALVELQSGEPGSPAHQSWLSNGLWLQTTSGGIHVFNALDENGVENTPAVGDRYRLLSISAG